MVEKERKKLDEACIVMHNVLQMDDPQLIANAIAGLQVSITNFMETGYISYSSVDSEIMNSRKLQCVL